MSVAADVRPSTRPLAVVDGCPVHLANARDALRQLTEATAEGRGFAFCPLNLDLLVKMRTDVAFRDAMLRARFIIADGWPIAMLGRRQHPAIERTTGADLILPLAEQAVARRLPIYLFGTSPAVLASVSETLKARIPGILLAGCESPLQGFDPASPAADEAIDRMMASGARLCFLALGAPKQEILATRALDRGARIGFVCVGAGLDFIAGAQRRAPGFMRNNRMEWLWRLATSPRRLGARYAACAVHLARITLMRS